ncbi:hypothetical protein D1831_03165 [Lactiplantibacillus garii]|uniref:RNase H type-1 domain-containing protein n=1 Tax=Lactiplantibacillus garii TaxID=2306423 RepID=A0A426D9E1_9LACO|nr:hypothetical protein [Lactiplantibacillus garii]RRK11239.1 hypothetical protein D1831_03165 [Lactiplantibacillus garii]
MTAIYVYVASSATMPDQPQGPAGWSAVLTYQEHHKVLTAGARGQSCAAMTLTALVRTLETLKRHDLPVIIVVPAGEILTAFNQQAYLGWAHNNWQTGETPVPNQRLWQRLVALSKTFPDLTLRERTTVKNEMLTRADSVLAATLTKLS